MKNTVYHYCSVDTFCKIIINKELWLTDITKSNDSKELKIVYEILTNRLNERTDIRKKIADDFVPLRLCKKFLERFLETKKLFHICCFSKESDLLSQWAMYSNNATGVSIGFDINKLSLLKELNNDIDFGKVEYMATPIFPNIDKRLDNIANLYFKRKDDNDFMWYNDFIKYIIEETQKVIYLYKDPSFKQEREYRLVINSRPCYDYKILDEKPKFKQQFNKNAIKLSDDYTIGEISYFVSNGKMISYRPLKITDLGAIINEIVIAPKSLVTKNDIEMLLIANGVNLSNKNIKVSKSTYC